MPPAIASARKFSFKERGSGWNAAERARPNAIRDFECNPTAPREGAVGSSGAVQETSIRAPFKGIIDGRS